MHLYVVDLKYKFNKVLKHAVNLKPSFQNKRTQISRLLLKCFMSLTENADNLDDNNRNSFYIL